MSKLLSYKALEEAETWACVKGTLAVDFPCTGHAFSVEVGRFGAHLGGDVCTALGGRVRKSPEGEGLREVGSGRRVHPWLHPERLGACPVGSREPVNVHL